MTERERLIDLLEEENAFSRYMTDDERRAKLADYLLENGVIVPPCKFGDWIWYTYRNEVNKAKVEEMQYDASKHGHYSYSFTIYAYDFKNKRELRWYPRNETIPDGNINDVEGMDCEEIVEVYTTREEAEKALKEREK